MCIWQTVNFFLCEINCISLLCFRYILILVSNLENINPCIVLLFGISFIILFIQEFVILGKSIKFHVKISSLYYVDFYIVVSFFAKFLFLL
jgi:hypothetical protein